MKDFLIKIVKFNSILFGSIIVLLIVKIGYEKNVVDCKLQKNKTILVVGDSHPECSINDSIFTSSFNISRSGTAYFYSYLKIKEIVKINPQIKTVVLGYSYKSIAKYKDKWFSGTDYIRNFLPEHFFLFNFSDFYSILVVNYHGVVSSIPFIITKSINNTNDLGKFLSLKENNLEEAKKRYNPNSNIGSDLSEYQMEYLLKIYNFTQEKNIKLVLLNAPMHQLVTENFNNSKSNYYSFAKKDLPNAKVVNHSDFKIPDFGFRDLFHLNYKGAKIYSEYLQSNGFNNSKNDTIINLNN